MKHVAGLIAGFLLPTLLSVAIGAELPPLKHSFVVIAHRGEHQMHHENTLEAIDGAIAAGADFVELDVRRSKDGQHILMHDSTVDRTTDGRGRVESLTWTELKNLQVSDCSLTEIPSSRIPTFADALAYCRDRIHIYLDFKAGDRAEVVDLIRKAGMMKQVLVYDAVDQIPAWRKVAPEIPLIVSPPGAAAGSPSALETFLKEHPCEVLDGNWSGWKPDVVQRAPMFGSRVWPDIQKSNEGPAYWEEVLAVGFTGVQTDHPKELIEWLKGRKLR